MRDIRFRGKRIENGEWVYGSLIQDGETKCQIVTFINHNETWCDISADTVGMFTGLKDCNGIDIYEGDILECPGIICVTLEVKYNYEQGAWCLAEHTHTEVVLIGSTPLGNMQMYYPTMKIIGNIHDNTELLEK